MPLTTTDAVTQLVAAVDAVVGADLASVPDSVLLADLETLLVVESRLRAEQVRRLGAAAARDATVGETGRQPRAWLVEEQSLSPREAGRRVRLARELPCAPVVAAAFAAGEVTAEHAQTVLRAVTETPDEHRDAVETALVQLSREADPSTVARAVDQVRQRVGVRETAEEAYARRHAERGVDLDITFGGTGSLAGTLTADTREQLALALQAAAGTCGPEDDRSARQRRHDALDTIARFFLAHADVADDTGERPRLVVTIQLDDLLSRAENGWATLDSGVQVSAETARRLCCDAEVIPAVLDARSEVLDLGRSTRGFNLAIRRAAKLRDGCRCAFPRCRNRIVDLHHVVWWSRGGTTSLDNAAWLCAFHHWLVHEGRWVMERDPGGGFRFEPAERRPVAA